MCLALEDKTEQVFRAVVPVIPLLTSSEHSSFSTSLSKLDMMVSGKVGLWIGVAAQLLASEIKLTCLSTNSLINGF